MCPRLGLILFCWFFVAQLLDGEVEAFQKQPLGGTELASQVAQAPYRGAHHPSDLAAGGTSDPTGNSTGGEGAGAPSLTEFSGRTGPGEATRHDVRPVAMRLWGYVQADGHVLPGMRSEMGSDQLCGLRSGGAGTLAMGGRHYSVPILIFEYGENQHVLMDPSVDGSGIHSVTVQPQSRPDLLLSPNQVNLGLTLWVNGAPQSVVRRPLRTGDYVQLLPEGQTVRFPSSHPAEILHHVNRLRCLSTPLCLPRFSQAAVRAALPSAAAEARQVLLNGIDRALQVRVERMGVPGRERQKVILLEPGRAPHHLWLELRTCPTLAEAEPLIREIRVISEDSRLVDTRIETLVSQVFVVVPPEVTGLTFTVPAPIHFRAHNLLHMPHGQTPPLHLLPVTEGMLLVSPPEWIDGADIRVARHMGYTRSAEAVARPPEAPARPVQVPAEREEPPAEPIVIEDDEPRPMTDSGQSAPMSVPASSSTQVSSAGTSLAQIPDRTHAQRKRCQQAERKGLISPACPCIAGQVRCVGQQPPRLDPELTDTVQIPPSLSPFFFLLEIW